MVRAAAPHIYPSTFRVLTGAQDDIGDGTRTADADDAVSHSMLRGLIPLTEEVQIRRLAVETIGGVLDRDDDAAQAASHLDDYIADTVAIASWTEPLARDVSAAGDLSGAAAEARMLLDSTRPPVSIEAVPVQGWEELLDGVFGMADATHATEGIRAAATSARYVVVDPHALAPDAEGLAAAISVLAGDAHRDGSGRYRMADGAGGLVDLDPGDAHSDDEAAYASDPIDLAEDAEHAIGQQDDPNQRDTVSLLAEVTGQFDAEIERSERDVERQIEMLHARMRHENRPEPGVTSFVAYALLASVLIGIGSLLTLTGLREVITPDRLSEQARLASFLLLALVATVPPVLRLTPSRSWSAQVRLTLVAAVYAGGAAVVVVTAPAVFENRNWRLLTVLLAIAVAVVIAAGGLVRLVRRRDRRQVSEWRQRIDELVDGCELGAARTAALEVLKAHWLTTAAVAARLVHRPFGSHRAATVPNDPAPAVRKLLMFDLELTEETRDAYLGELLPELASSGWLREQYRRMSSRFVSSERSRFGIGADGYMPPPEHCTYPMALRSALSAEGSGSRWRFAERVYAGEFDSVLHEAAEEALNRAMTATFMSDHIAVSLGPADADCQTLPRLLGEMLPAGEARLPSGTLPPSTESPPEYQSLVWWPEAVSMPPEHGPAAHQCRHLRVQGTILFHTVRVDISEPVGMERLTPIGEPDVSAPVGAGGLAMHGSAGAPAEPLM